MATRTSVVGGSALSPLDWFDPATWVGGTVPASGDRIVISAGSYIRGTAEFDWLEHYSAVVRIFGWLSLGGDPNFNFNGLFGSTLTVVENGGRLTVNNVFTFSESLIVVNAGGELHSVYEMQAGTIPAVIVRHGGLAYFGGDTNMYSPVLAESGSSVTFEAFSYTSSVTGLYADVDYFDEDGGKPTYQFGADVRTMIHSGDPTDEDFITDLGPLGGTWWNANSPSVAPLEFVADGVTNINGTGTLVAAELLPPSVVKAGVDRGDGVKGTHRTRKPLINF